MNRFIKKINNNILKLSLILLVIYNPSNLEAQNILNSQPITTNSNKVISILSFNITYNNLNLTRYSKTKCSLEFYDDYKQKTTNIVDKNNNFVIIYSNPGKVYLDNVKCSRHSIPLIYGKSRNKKIDDWGFVAYNGYINYAGEINIKYNHDNFKVLDLINMSGSFEDNSGFVQIEVKDKILDAISYTRIRFQDPEPFKIAKSLLKDTQNLKPNDVTEIFNIMGEKITNKISEQDNKAINPAIKTDGKEINSKNTPINIYENIKDNQPSEINTPPNARPSHPYLAPIYSEFYMPNYNPYLAVGDPFNPYNHRVGEVQDPVIEHRHD